MAKPRKQKQGIVPAEEAALAPMFVRHQKLRIAINMERQLVYGHAELHLVYRKGEALDLHVGQIVVTDVTIDGTSAKFERKQRTSSEKQSYSSQSIKSAASTVRSRYISALEEELTPDFTVTLPSSTDKENALSVVTSNGEAQEPTTVATPKTEDVRVVVVNFYIDKPETDHLFKNDIFHTNNSRRWFPSFGSASSRCSYDLEVTINRDYVAVSVGKLLYQVANEDASTKTFVYELTIPTSSNNVNLIVARMAVVPERQHPTVSHLCSSKNGYPSKLQFTVKFFHSLFSLFEEYLQSKFPFGAYTQVFLDSDHLISSVTVSAALVTFGTHLLADEKIIDQAILTQIKLAHALAKQWFGVFITPESDRDDWLLEGISGFLAHVFIKRFLGFNELLFRRWKMIGTVTEADVDTAAPLSPPTLPRAAYAGEKLGLVGKLRSLKSVAVIHMLEKQMGPEPFRKVLQKIVERAKDQKLRTLSTKEFRHLANKIGNMERLVLKEFFPRWVESQGCPVLKMEYEYKQKRNYVEFSARRSCTAPSIRVQGKAGMRPIADVGWPGMMNIQIHENDGVHDHPNLSLSGDVHQQLELQCSSKARRMQRPKKPGKVEIIDDLADDKPVVESVVYFIRPDPAMDYLAKIELQQPEQMWVNQLERDKDVIAQFQAIAALKHFPNSYTIVHALNNCLIDSKIFCRVRIEAAFALAVHATEVTSFAGLNNLMKFYKSRCFDAEIGLPKPNNFHDFPEYFTLQAIPLAIASVRGIQGSSPPEAVEFILNILKHNDNSGNAYSDSYWLSAIIEAAGHLEVPQQSFERLGRILKQLDHLLGSDRLMPSFNRLVTRSCIRTIALLATKFTSSLTMDLIEQKISPFRNAETNYWQLRVTACEALMDLKIKVDGIDKMLRLAMAFVQEDPCLRVQTRIMSHASNAVIYKRKGADVDTSTISSLVKMFGSEYCRRNQFLRHHIYTILQVLAGRSASLIGKTPEQRKDDTSLKVRIPATPQAQAQEGPPRETGLKLRVVQTPKPPPAPTPKIGPVKIRMPPDWKPEASRTQSEVPRPQPVTLTVQVKANNETVADNMDVGPMDIDVISKPKTEPGTAAATAVADGGTEAERKEKRRKEKKERKEKNKDKKKDKKDRKEKKKKHKKDKQPDGPSDVQPSIPPLAAPPQRQPNELLQVKQEIAEAAAVSAEPTERLEIGPSPGRKRPGEVIRLKIKRPKLDPEG